MNVIIRDPAPGDIGWLISTHGASYSEQFNFNSDFEFDIARKVVGFLDKQCEFNKIWIAQAGCDRVGSIAVSLAENRAAFINFMLVKKEFGGCGIARQLMEAVIRHSHEFNIRSIRLETYNCLKDARNLYKKYGFEPYDVRFHVEKYGQSFDQEFWEKKL